MSAPVPATLEHRVARAMRKHRLDPVGEELRARPGCHRRRLSAVVAVRKQYALGDLIRASRSLS
jgi:hypothetical protein